MVTARTGGGLSDGTKDGDGNQRVDPGTKKLEVIKEEDWCQITAEKCKDVDLKTQMTSIIGQLLYDIQNSGGNIGTYYTSKITGGVTNAIGEGRTKIDKAIKVVREF